MNARRASAATLSLIAVVLATATALAGAWRAVPGASRYAVRGARTVVLELQQEGGGGCGGGGCNTGVAIRNVRGTLPSSDLSYYYSDRPGAAPGCLGRQYAELFSSWAEAEIAPARGGESARPHCGIGMMVGNQMRYWVILRVRTVSAAPSAAGAARSGP